MKIIKEGRLPEQRRRVYEGECTNCGCVVEVYEEEIESYHRGLALINCPTLYCNGNILMMPKIGVEGRE